MMARFIVLAALFAFALVASAATPEWTGTGSCRVLVKVDPVDIGSRKSDELVAQYAVDFIAILKEQHLAGEADLSTLQVQKYDADTGKAEKFKSFANAVSEFDRPCRFEDETVPEDYPDSVTRASTVESGRGPNIIRKRGGRLFNREMENTHGKITWVHTQVGHASSFYAIYWDVKKNLAECGPSPSPWIGDADVLRAKEGQRLGGLSHFNAGFGDFNGDGLFDIVAGCEKGNLMWFPNHGTRIEPKFIGCRMLTDEQGPIDTGWYGTPVLFDWDSDGLVDLLAGTNHNVILWWKNVGTKTQPKLNYRGFVQADGKKLQVPAAPVPEDKANIFKEDYYNQPWVGDWDGDGVPDILTGGYITGEIFFFKGSGRNADGTPQLSYIGPLQAHGQTLDTVWAAAPFAYDFDGDGDMDLVTGSWFWSGIHRPMRTGEVEYIMYYQNVGTATKPQLVRAPFPGDADKFPKGTIARPSVIDWNHDGLPDLVVSDAGGSIYHWMNNGKPNAPRWDVNETQLTAPWAFTRDGGYTSLGMVEPSGAQEVQDGFAITAYEGSPYTPKRVSRGQITVDGHALSYHGPGYGDPYCYVTMVDWDGDGLKDALVGTHQGEVYFHRALPGNYRNFAPGVKLKLKTGEALRVGPEVVDSPEKAKNFTVLQGSRIVMTGADFDGDGIPDLAVTETFGNIWIYLNSAKGGTDTLAPAVNIGKVFGSSRTNDLSIVDWNDDGKPDLIIGPPLNKPGTIYINKSTPGDVAFAEPTQPFELPFMFWGSIFKPIDWNKDGDEDFLVFSEFYSFFVEKSFIQYGYREAAPIGKPETHLKELSPP